MEQKLTLKLIYYLQFYFCVTQHQEARSREVACCEQTSAKEEKRNSERAWDNNEGKAEGEEREEERLRLG